MVTTATGDEELELYQDAKIELEGRSGTFECIALPDGSTPLLGVVPLEMLGLEPDLQNQRLRVLPDAGRDTYMLALHHDSTEPPSVSLGLGVSRAGGELCRPGTLNTYT